MFKNVEYIGFEDKPDLKAKAEQLTSILAGEIHRWRDDVEVRLSSPPGSVADPLELTLSLTLPNGVSAMHSGTFVDGDFASERRAARRCRRVWSDLLGILLEKQHERIEESILEASEM
jgi:hypothetical protein